jgi:hypothetical protein
MGMLSLENTIDSSAKSVQYYCVMTDPIASYLGSQAHLAGNMIRSSK